MDKYRGRFAPSATGPLHLGSVFAALISFLDARYHNGVWLVRIDDLDRFRCSSEHAESILQCLLSFGMEPDEPVIYQSERLNQYAKKFMEETCIGVNHFNSILTKINSKNVDERYNFFSTHPQLNKRILEESKNC